MALPGELGIAQRRDKSTGGVLLPAVSHVATSLEKQGFSTCMDGDPTFPGYVAHRRAPEQPMSDRVEASNSGIDQTYEPWLPSSREPENQLPHGAPRGGRGSFIHSAELFSENEADILPHNAIRELTPPPGLGHVSGENDEDHQLQARRLQIRTSIEERYDMPGPSRYVRGADATVKRRRRAVQNRISGRVSRQLAEERLYMLEHEAQSLEVREAQIAEELSSLTRGIPEMEQLGAGSGGSPGIEPQS